MHFMDVEAQRVLTGQRQRELEAAATHRGYKPAGRESRLARLRRAVRPKPGRGLRPARAATP